MSSQPLLLIGLLSLLAHRPNYSCGVRVLVNDYAGHPFTLSLSNELGRRGHSVTHSWCPSVLAPKAEFGTRHEAVTLAPLSLCNPIPRNQFLARWLAEREFGMLLADTIRAATPEVVLSANTPIDAQERALNAARSTGAKFVHWLQDVYWVALRGLLPRHFGPARQALSFVYRLREERILRRSDLVVSISTDFIPYVQRAGVSSSRAFVIPNWAPIEQLPLRSRHNDWAATHGWIDGLNFVYTGTLALKHGVRTLLDIASALSAYTDGRLIVVSEGPGADALRSTANASGLENVYVLPFQPFNAMPDVMATADVLVVVLKAEAGIFSVPSKVLSYMCAGRPILASVPPTNEAARIISHGGLGIVVDPSDRPGLLEAVAQLASDDTLRDAMGRRSREYAEDHFVLDKIGDRFETLLDGLRH